MTLRADCAEATCASGTMPGELHKTQVADTGGYPMEHGFFCMGYEVPGTLGLKMARLGGGTRSTTCSTTAVP